MGRLENEKGLGKEIMKEESDQLGTGYHKSMKAWTGGGRTRQTEDR
jgi:hypothetical protein